MQIWVVGWCSNFIIAIKSYNKNLIIIKVCMIINGFILLNHIPTTDWKCDHIHTHKKPNWKVKWPIWPMMMHCTIMGHNFGPMKNTPMWSKNPHFHPSRFYNFSFIESFPFHSVHCMHLAPTVPWCTLKRASKKLRWQKLGYLGFIIIHLPLIINTKELCFSSEISFSV
jgi:hypothetical protein